MFPRTLARPIALAAAALLVACTPASQGDQPGNSPPLSVTATTQPPSRIDPSASWIEIDLAKQILALHQGGGVLAEYAVSTGVMSDPKYVTPPDLYRVQSKDKGPVESAPGVFVADIVMFDLGRGNGIHSLPMDPAGAVLDATLGTPGTAGCVRVAESSRVFAFAQLGMWVWIH